MTSPYRRYYLVNLCKFASVLGSRLHADLTSAWKFAVRPGLSLLQVLSGCLNWRCSLYLLFQVSESPRLLWLWNLLVCSIANSHSLAVHRWQPSDTSSGLTGCFPLPCCTHDGRVRIKHLNSDFRASSRFLKDWFLKPLSYLHFPLAGKEEWNLVKVKTLPVHWESPH